MNNALARETIGRRLLVSSYELVLAYLEYARAAKHNSRESLEKIMRFSRELRNGMAYAEKVQLISHHDICRLLEQLVIIDRLTKNAYLKTLRAEKLEKVEPTNPTDQPQYVKKSRSSLLSTRSKS